MITQATAKRRLGYRFGVVIAALAGAWLIRAVTARLDLNLPTSLQDFLTLSLSIVIEAFPFVLLGLALSAIVQLFVSQKTLYRFLPSSPLLRRGMLSVLGVFLPVCECGNVPLARGFMVKGLSVSESLTFLLAAPILNPVTLIATAQAFRFDKSVVVIRAVAGFMIANIVGWLVSRHPNEQELMTDSFAAQCKVHNHETRRRPRWQQAASLLRHEARVIVPPLLVGALIAGASQAFIPRSILTNLGSDPVISILAMMALAFIISICANVDAFFALAFAGTFSHGAIVSFLVFGPMIDIKMLSLLRTTYKVRLLVFVSLLVAVLSVLTGLVVNYVF